MDLPDPKPRQVVFKLDGIKGYRLERLAEHLQMTPNALAKEIVEKWLKER